MQFETTMKMLQSVLVAHEIYKCLFENTMMFSNDLLASGSCKLDALVILFPQTAHASANFQKINTLKYLNLDKLKHYITCKSYTKVNSKVRFT